MVQIMPTSRVCFYVCILYFVFCIFKAAQEMMQMMPTSRVFCAIQDKRGCEGISLLWCNLFSNRATTLMQIMKMLKMIKMLKMFKELKCCKCSTGGQRLQTAGGAFRLVQDSKLALEQIPFGGGLHNSTNHSSARANLNLYFDFQCESLS